MVARWVVVGCGLGGSLCASVAKAAPETHDGVLVEVDLGIAFGSVDSEQDSPPTVAGLELPSSSTLSGSGGAVDLLVGGTVIDGLVIGAMLSARSLLDPTVEYDDGTELQTEDTSARLTLFGPFVQFYPDPSGGLFVRGALGYAGESVQAGDIEAELEPTGLGLAAAVGYTFWVSDEWSIGPVGSLTYANLSATENGFELKDTWLLPAISVAFTYH